MALLISEPPLQVLPSLAERIGLNEAIFVQQLHYWTLRSENEHDGRRWVYNTIREWRERNFPFWSERTIERLVAKLSESGLVLKRRNPSNPLDATNWYALNYGRLGELAPDPTSPPRWRGSDRQDDGTPTASMADCYAGASSSSSETTTETSYMLTPVEGDEGQGVLIPLEDPSAEEVFRVLSEAATTRRFAVPSRSSVLKALGFAGPGTDVLEIARTVAFEITDGRYARKRSANVAAILRTWLANDAKFRPRQQATKTTTADGQYYEFYENDHTPEQMAAVEEARRFRVAS